VSHSHFDHVAEAVAIATGANAKLIGAADRVRSLELPKDLARRGNPGLGES
jgi:L-ascorbate metabolism protein UlaG (beta-lactamase superfamily)